jgi:hypothetical protein
VPRDRLQATFRSKSIKHIFNKENNHETFRSKNGHLVDSSRPRFAGYSSEVRSHFAAIQPLFLVHGCRLAALCSRDNGRDAINQITMVAGRSSPFLLVAKNSCKIAGVLYFQFFKIN